MQRSLTINIEINEIETETIKVSSVQELNSKLTAFFDNYNINESLLQSKIKRRVLASYNRLLKESNLAAVQKPTNDKKQPTVPQTDSRKPIAQPNNQLIKPKSSMFDFGVKVGIGGSAFLKHYTFGQQQLKSLKLPTEKQNKFTGTELSKRKEPISETNLNGFEVRKRNFKDFEFRKADNGLSKTEFTASRQKESSRFDNDWLVAQFGTPKVPANWKGQLGEEVAGIKSLAEEGLLQLEKTNKKPSVEVSLDRRKTVVNQNVNGGQFESHQERLAMNRHSSIREPIKPFYGIDTQAVGGSPVAQQSLSPQQVFSLLDGMKIGLISQKNMNISSLSVSYLKRLQPLIARIYSGDETTCFDFKDFEKMLTSLKIDI